MRKFLLALLTMSVLFTAAPAVALTIDLIAADDNTAINNWISGLGGNVTVLEDFETQSAGWYQSLSTSVGTFSAGGNIGVGATSYNANHDVSSDQPHFTVRDQAWYGRGNTTSGGTMYLDSADITEIKLDLSVSVTNLFFYLQDPSDVRAITTFGSQGYSQAFPTSLANGSLWFVGISSDDFLSSVSWTTSNQNDGYGLDDFSTVAPVPEPATMLLLGTGLVGLATVSRKKFQK